MVDERESKMEFGKVLTWVEVCTVQVHLYGSRIVNTKLGRDRETFVASWSIKQTERPEWR